MFDRRQLVARSAAIMLMFASFGYAQADDANEYLAEVRDDLDLADGADILTTNRTAKADADGDELYVIEEIVVIGRKKSQHPNLGNSSGTNPVVQMPGWIDWQFLPRYYPEQADRYFDLIPLAVGIRRGGFIELFRVGIGR